MTASEIVIVFTRYPVPGKSKTRLIPELGPEGAAALQRRMTESLVREMRSDARYRLQIRCEGGPESLFRAWLGDDLEYLPQYGADLGQKMSNALNAQQRLGRTACLIGSDCPGIDRHIVGEAFGALTGHDVVLGPSHDGGYYLIGCRPDVDTGHTAELFRTIEWGTQDVLAHTVSRLAHLNLSYYLLPKLHDIDTPDDLRHLRYHPRGR